MMCAGAFHSPFHVGIATPDMDTVMRALGSLLGLTWVPLHRPPILHHTPMGPVRPSSRVVYSVQGPMYVEVLQSEPGTIYDPAWGTHLHHVGCWTSDFASDLAEAQSQGWILEASMCDDAGLPVTFAYITRPGDVRVELVDISQRPGLEALLSADTSRSPGPADRRSGFA